MTKTTQRLRTFSKLPLALAVAASISAPVSAFEFQLGEEMDASLDTTLSIGASWRVAEREKFLLGAGNYYTTGAAAWANAEGAGSSINNDDGNWNFEKGDTYSKIVRGTTDFSVKWEDYGIFTRARYWYDFQLKDGEMAKDNNGKERTLSKDGKDNASGGEILDAYVYGDFYLNDMPLNLRAGSQVLSWGESTFIPNGINVINPIDVPAIRAPGAELKDALLPVNMIYGSLGLTDNLTLEAYVQLEFDHVRIDDCGTFYSNVDYVADGCGPVIVSSRTLLPAATEDQLLGFTHPQLGALPAVVRRNDALEDKWYPDGEDQYGAALRWYVPELDGTEFGFYFVQYHSRMPFVTGTNGLYTGALYGTLPPFTSAPTANALIPILTGGAIPNPNYSQYAPTYARGYSKRIKMYGISFNTTGPFGMSLGGEYSLKRDMPLQTNAFDALFNGFGLLHTPQVRALTPNAGDANNNFYADTNVAYLSGAAVPADTFDVSQLQFTGIKFWDQVLGASRLAVVGEVGFTYVHDLPDESVNRYGRYAQLGFGTTITDYVDESLNPSTGVDMTPQQACENLYNFNNAGCTTEGYTTDFSWGYRLRGNLTYSDVFAGVNLSPGLAWSHDVAGHAPEPGGSFIEGRKSVGLLLTADYMNAYSATLAYNNYFGAKDGLNYLVDKDDVQLSVSYSF